MTAVDDLVTWQREQLDEDERIAMGAVASPWSAEDEDGFLTYGEFGWYVAGAGVETEDSEVGKDTARHIARWDPARVLAEVEAKRRLIDFSYPTRIPALQDVAYMVILHLAQPYADRPGFKDEWKLS